LKPSTAWATVSRNNMARPRKLLWKLYPSYLLITVFSILAIGLYSSNEIKNFFIEQIESDLAQKAQLVAKLIAGRYSLQYQKEVDDICKQSIGKRPLRITVILPSGTVIGDSDVDPLKMENHLDRPEVGMALLGKSGTVIRFSPTEKKEMVYVAIPAFKDSKVIGIVRAAMPMTNISRSLHALYFKIAALGVIVAIFAALISLMMAERINKILSEMKRGAERFAGGDLGYRLYMPESEETAALAQALNQMAGQLQERIQEITSQKNELEAVLKSMVESVLVVDREQNILSFNRAAAGLLGLKPEAQGRSMQETIRSPGLQKFAALTLESKEPVTDEIISYQEGEKYLQAHGTLLRDTRNEINAALLVLHDITGLKKLENMRKEFVANVSHELKTPITAVKGFVETLKEGASREPENLNKFLEIINNHADRLNSIIDDLLILSRIEQSEGAGGMVLEETKIKPVLDSAMALNQNKVAEKNIKIEAQIPEELKARINPELIEQAVSNLINNAIKYSEPGGVISIRAEQAQNELEIMVEDHGIGIPKEHLPRIFERFYRVDKARSRNQGGTGLGLAIVKHIVAAHKGRVAVDSTPGKGSKFSIFLPLA